MISVYSIERYSKDIKYFQDLSENDIEKLYKETIDETFLLPVIKYSDSITIGPIYSKKVGSCCFCMESRSNFTLFSKESSESILPPDRILIKSIVSMMVRKKEYNICYTISYKKEIEVERHKFLNRFDCEICGKKINESLRYNFKENWDSDTLRLRNADLYLEELENTLVGKNFGIIKNISTKKFQDGYQVIAVMEENQRTTSSSFNRSKSQAKAVCLLEALERYSSLKPRLNIKTFQSNILNLDGYIQPEEYMYEINESQIIKWISVFSVKDRLVKKIIPEGTIFNTSESKELNYQPSSNGIATGTCVTEAQIHALLEVNERDALLLQWYSDKPLRDITEYAKRHLDYEESISEYGYVYKIFDITSDTNIPTIWIVAQLAEPNSDYPHFISGSSSMLNISDAIKSAFKEVTMIILNDYEYKRVRERINAVKKGERNVVTVEDHLYYYGFNQEGIEYMKAYITKSSPTTLSHSKKENYTLQKALSYILENFNRCGIDSYYLDITPQEISINNLSVVKIICTNTIPINFGYEKNKNVIEKIKKMKRKSFENYRFKFRLHPLA